MAALSGFVGACAARPVVGSLACCSRQVTLRSRRPVRPRRMQPRAELFLSEENVESVLGESRRTLGTMFGSDENKEVGITGDVELVEIDGPTVVLRLTGRFWHKRSDVERIPEIVDVEIEDVAQLNDADERPDPLHM